MNFFKSLFGPKPAPPRNLLPLKVKCRRCGEIIESRVDMSNDLSLDYDEAGTPSITATRASSAGNIAIKRLKWSCSSTPIAA